MPKDMLRGFGEGGALVEFGSGSSRKTEILLARLPHLAIYAPMTTCQTALNGATRRLARLYPRLSTHHPRRLHPGGPAAGRRRTHSSAWLFSRLDDRQFRSAVGHRFATGDALDARTGQRARNQHDLEQPRMLIEAYNDSGRRDGGIQPKPTGARRSRVSGADFDLDAFRHEAVYDPLKGQIEMRLVRGRAQSAGNSGRAISLSRRRAHPHGKFL